MDGPQNKVQRLDEQVDGQVSSIHAVCGSIRKRSLHSMHLPKLGDARTKAHDHIWRKVCGVIQKSVKAQRHAHHFETEVENIPRLKYSKKGVTRMDGKQITEEFGNRRPDGVVTLKHSTESTEAQIDT